MKLLIIITFTILSFSCFSQVRESVNGDTLLQDFWEAENYGRERKSLEDSVKISVWRDYDETASCGSYCHIIENKSERNLVVFLIEEENYTLPQVKLLRRKLYRRYADFAFFVIVWDNIVFEKSNTVTPDLFVKILKPEEKFELVVPFANNDEEQIASEVSRHLLVCSETLFYSDEIGMPDFIKMVKYYGVDYVDTQVVISPDTFKSFLSNLDKKSLYK